MLTAPESMDVKRAWSLLSKALSPVYITDVYALIFEAKNHLEKALGISVETEPKEA